MEQLSFKKVATEFLRLFTIALKNISFYTEYHPLGKSSLKKCYDVLSTILTERSEFTISAAEDRMLADESIIDDEKMLMSSIAKQFSERDISSITFQRGISKAHLKTLISVFMQRPEQIRERGGISRTIEEADISFIQANTVKYGRISESQELLDIALAEHIITGIKPLMVQDREGYENTEEGSPAKPTPLFTGATQGMKDSIPFDEILKDPLKISLLFAQTLKNFQADSPAGTASEKDILLALEKLGAQLQSQAGGDWNKLKLIFAQLIMSLRPEIQHLVVEKSISHSTKSSIFKSILTYMPEEKIGDLVTSQYLAGVKEPKAIADFIVKVLPADDRKEETLSKIKEKLQSLGLSEEEIQKISDEVTWLKDPFDHKISTLLAGEKIWQKPFPAVMEIIEEANRKGSTNEAMLLIQKYMSGLIHVSADIRKSVIENSIPLFVFMKERKHFESRRIKLQNLLLRRMKDEEEKDLFDSLVKTLVATAISEMDSGNYSEAIPVLEKMKRSIGDTFEDDPVKKEIIQNEITKLESEDLLTKILEDYFASKPGSEQNLPKLLEIFGEFTIKFLIARMASEENRKKRYKISLLIKSLKNAALPTLIDCFHDQKWFLVRNAILLIGEIGDPSVVSSLKEPLQHTDHRVRRETVRALMKLGSNDAYDLIASALDDTDESVVIAAMEALGNVKSTKGILQMIRIVSRSNGHDTADDLLRRAAIENLGKLKAKEAVPELMQLLTKKGLFGMNESPEIRLEAIKALGEIGGEDALNALVQASEKDPHPNIREVAAVLLSERSHDDS